MPIQPISKFPNGKSRHEDRIERRNARKLHEQQVKAEVRARDGKGCRWPGCEFWRKGVAVEGAHMISKGRGGDPAGIRTQRASLIRLCALHHRGPCSIHSGDLDIVFLTERGTDGPVQFLRKNPKAKDGWEVEASEDEFTITKLAKTARDQFAEDEGDEAEP